MADFVWSDDSRRHEIVNLVQTDLLRPEFLPDRIKTFDASFDEHKRNFRFVHLFLDAGGDVLQKRFVLRTPFLELLGKFAIVFRMEMAKRKFFKLAARLTHAEAVR